MMNGRGGRGGKTRCEIGWYGVLTPFFPFDEATRIGLSYRTNECTGGIICVRDAECQGHAQVTIVSKAGRVKTCACEPPLVPASNTRCEQTQWCRVEHPKIAPRRHHLHAALWFHAQNFETLGFTGCALPSKGSLPHLRQICAVGINAGPWGSGWRRCCCPPHILSCRNQCLWSLP